MMEIKVLNADSDFKDGERKLFIDFMFNSLGEYGDPKVDINRCIDYAFSTDKFAGGFTLAAYEGEKLIGGLIMNRTGMSGYIPDWILVYVAVDPSCRGKGYGRDIIEHALKKCEGDVKLHVEYDNPAKRLYERIGFNSKYAEMRYKK